MRNRITGLRTMRASDLRRNPANWRVHPESQRRAVGSVLSSIGQWATLIIRDTPDGPEIIDGHLRADLAGDDEITCAVVDLTDAEARVALASHDPLAAMADTNREALRDLLADLPEMDAPDLSATLDALAGASAPPRTQPRADDSTPPPAPPQGTDPGDGVPPEYPPVLKHTKVFCPRCGAGFEV